MAGNLEAMRGERNGCGQLAGNIAGKAWAGKHQWLQAWADLRKHIGHEEGGGLFYPLRGDGSRYAAGEMRPELSHDLPHCLCRAGNQQQVGIAESGGL